VYFCYAMRCVSAAYVGMRCLSVRPSVCLSVTFVDHVKTNKHIFEFFSPSGSHTILVFFIPNGVAYSDGNPPPPLTGASNAGGVGKNEIPDEYLAVLDMCVLVLAAYLPRNADWSISWSFPYQFAPTRTQYSNEGPQHWNAAHFPKNAF